MQHPVKAPCTTASPLARFADRVTARLFTPASCLAITAGKVPPELWTLPCLRVVALHGNSFTGATRAGDGRLCSHAGILDLYIRRVDPPSMILVSCHTTTPPAFSPSRKDFATYCTTHPAPPPLRSLARHSPAFVSCPVTPPDAFRPARGGFLKPESHPQQPERRRHGVAVRSTYPIGLIHRAPPRCR